MRKSPRRPAVHQTFLLHSRPCRNARGQVVDPMAKAQVGLVDVLILRTISVRRLAPSARPHCSIPRQTLLLALWVTRQHRAARGNPRRCVTRRPQAVSNCHGLVLVKLHPILAWGMRSPHRRPVTEVWGLLHQQLMTGAKRRAAASPRVVAPPTPELLRVHRGNWASLNPSSKSHEMITRNRPATPLARRQMRQHSAGVTRQQATRRTGPPWRRSGLLK